MPVYTQQEILNFESEFVYNIVADVENYPLFIPWICSLTKKNTLEPHCFEADVRVGYKMIQERYTCRVVLTPHTHIHVAHIQGPFKCLETKWDFEPVMEHNQLKTHVSFYIHFEFQSGLLNTIMSQVFYQAAQKTFNAFIQRAHTLHQPSL